MIRELDIQNLAVIDHLRIKFSSGMTVLTGETGAGKSIIIDALNLLTGSRGSRRFIRRGKKKLILQGLATFPADSVTYRVLDQLGIDHSDGNVILQRTIFRSGRNVCRINGRLVNTTTLRKVGRTVVDIQGQDSHQVLMDARNHVRLLDAFAAEKISPVFKKYRSLYRRYLKIKRTLQSRTANHRAFAQRLDMLRFQIKDIGSAHLKPHEDTDLESKQKLLKNHQNVSDALKKSYTDVNGDGNYSPLDLIGDAMSQMSDISSYDKGFKQVADDLQNAYYTLQDVVNRLSEQIEGQDYDPDALNRIGSRLDLIAQLKNKYGNTIKQILQYYSKITKQVNRVDSGQDNGKALTKKFKTVTRHLMTEGRKLDQIRHRVAVTLEDRIQKQLASLYMKAARFKVRFVKRDVPDATGLERVEFYVRTNPGEGMSPLAQSASGGEMSRIMLALKTVFARVQNIDTIVFDEIDTGVSGRVAQAIGDKMHLISEHLQVLCITHLPQVAAMSNHHYLVTKHVSADSTRTRVNGLDNDGKIRELARMLAGPKMTKLTMEHAHELLVLATQVKKKS